MEDFTKPLKESSFLSKEDLETLFEGAFAQINGAFNNKDLNSPVSAPLLDKKRTSSLKERSKSSLRLKYEAEVSVIQKSYGNLEDIRRKLGLSKRKMAQLLLVDPSAWTRWTTTQDMAPPHIYRALQWYMILQEKHPELKSSIWLNAVAQPQISQHEIENIKKSIQKDLILSPTNKPNQISFMDEYLKEIETKLKKESLQTQKRQTHLVLLVIMQSILLFASLMFLLLK